MSNKLMTSGTGLLLLALGGMGLFAGASWARTPQPNASSTVDLEREGGPVFHLLTARSDVGASRYRRGLDQLGLAETRLLNDRAAMPGAPPEPLQRALTDVATARASASRGHREATIAAINDALQAIQSPGGAVVVSTASPQPVQLLQQQAPLPPPPAPPAVLYRLEPGHWQLRGAESVWVEPQSVPQPVALEVVVPSRLSWNGDRWVLVPEHFTGGEAVR